MLSKEEIRKAIPYLSASKIHLYLSCPNSFFLKYIEKVEYAETNDSYAKYGTLLHEIYENIANGMYDDIHIPLNEYIVGYGECGLKDSQYDTYYNQGLQSIHEQWEHLNSVEVIKAEAKFNCKPLDAPPFFGFVDLVYRDENGKLVVRDYKTSKPYTKQQMQHNVQAYVYAEACKTLYGEYPDRFEFEFVRFNEKATIIIDENYLKFNALFIQGIWNKIESGIRKSVKNPFFCENFCQGRNECPLYQSMKGMF